jgi:hypothetical protein
MDEQGDGAVVRRMATKGSQHHKNASNDAGGPADTNARPSVDNKCPLCQTYGHHKYNCNQMALWLHLKEGSKLVDDKLRLKIHANYADIDAKRRSKKLGKIRGTVRQLYETGKFEEGEQLLDSAIPQLTNDIVDPVNDASESDGSSAS